MILLVRSWCVPRQVNIYLSYFSAMAASPL